jgi:protein gp37
MFGDNSLPQNLWLGTTCENQEQYNKRAPYLAQFNCVTFISVEPQLERVSLAENVRAANAIDWVICGGESGPGCRPFNVEWARELRDQCRENGIPFFMKQLGGHPSKRDRLEDLPEDLRIREFPK